MHPCFLGHLDRFSRFSGLTIVTERPTDQATSVTIGRIYVRSTAIWLKNCSLCQRRYVASNTSKNAEIIKRMTLLSRTLPKTVNVLLSKMAVNTYDAFPAKTAQIM